MAGTRTIRVLFVSHHWHIIGMWHVEFTVYGVDLGVAMHLVISIKGSRWLVPQITDEIPCSQYIGHRQAGWAT